MANPETVYLKDYRVPDFLCESLDLVFDLQDTHTEVSATIQFKRHPKGQPNAPLVLDGVALTLKHLTIDDQTLSDDAWTVTEDTLQVHTVPEAFTLHTVVHIDPANNQTLSGLYQSSGNYCTQCESEGFRRITYFLDRPDVLTYFKTTIRADKQRYPQLLSNGDCQDAMDLPEGRHQVTWVDPSLKPCYLFALVAGDFDVAEDRFQTSDGRDVALRIYVEKGFQHQVSHAMDALKLSMAWDERAYGLAYDLNCYMVVAVGDFNFGAMENKGLNIFNTKYVLADPDVATDIDYRNVLAVIGHEYFHNWSGNRVTCRDWFQISLKEGLTVFREHAFVADHTSPGVKRIQDAALIRDQQFAEDRGPMSHPVRPDHYIEINNFYTLTVYHKGSELIRMLWLLLGPKQYREATDLYFSRFDGQAVTTDDFVDVMAEVSGMSLQQFRRWYDVAGTPHVAVKGVYDAAKQTYQLTFSQRTPRSAQGPMHIPIALGLVSPSGEPLSWCVTPDDTVPQHDTLFQLTETKQVLTCYRVADAPIPSVLRGFSAPVSLSIDLTAEALHTLWRHDTDPYKRWDAGMQLIVDAILTRDESLFSEKSADIAETFAYLLAQDEGVDLALQTQLLTMPAEAYVLQQQLPCDLDHVLAQYHALKMHLSTHLSDAWLSGYRLHHDAEAYAVDIHAVNRRAFKNMCLSYVSVQSDASMIELAYQQYQGADNLTDRLAAMHALLDHQSDAREAVLEDFYQRGVGQALIRDRWFQLQAASRLPGALERVRALMGHEDFHWQNPNRVRSLLGVFSQSHLPAFHDRTGAGYALLVDAVTTLDAINPQTAARLMEPLTRWRQYDDVRAKMMCDQMRRLLSESHLSKGVYEVVSRSLDQA